MRLELSFGERHRHLIGLFSLATATPTLTLSVSRKFTSLCVNESFTGGWVGEGRYNSLSGPVFTHHIYHPALIYSHRPGTI